MLHKTYTINISLITARFCSYIGRVSVLEGSMNYEDPNNYLTLDYKECHSGWHNRYYGRIALSRFHYITYLIGDEFNVLKKPNLTGKFDPDVKHEVCNNFYYTTVVHL
jgi:hypothetical protein